MWRKIDGFSAYEAGANGEIRRIIAGRRSPAVPYVVSTCMIKGYLHVNILSDAGKYKLIAVHILVCTAFHGAKPSPDHTVDHEDRVKTNNVASNLKWATLKEQRDNGCRGEDRPDSILTESVVRDMRARHAAGESYSKIARSLGLAKSTVGHAIARINWKHVT